MLTNEERELYALRNENKRLKSDCFNHGQHIMALGERLSEKKAEVAKLRAALQKAVDDYGKPGGPRNVPSEPGTWLQMAKDALGGE